MDTIAVGPVPAEDGDNLLLADSIISVSVAETASRMTATIKTNGPAAADTCTVLVSTDAAATDPDTATPTAADYEVQLKEAIKQSYYC